MNRVPRIYKLIAVFTALCLECTSISIPTLHAQTVPQNILSVKKLNPEILKLPEKFGEVVESHAGNGNVIVVQDAHAIPDAQKNIANVIKYMQQEYGVGTVALEGASGDLDPQIFRSFPDKKLLREVMNGYMNSGEIAGGTAAAIFDETTTKYVGVEDWDVYEEGLGLYLSAMDKTAAIEAQLSALREKLNKEKEAIYPRALLEVDHEIEKFYENAAQLTELIKVLGAIQAPKAGSELEAVWKEVSKAHSPATGGERKDIEVRALAAKVEKVLKSPGAVKAFNSRKQEWMTGQISAEAFALNLKEFADQSGLNLEMSSDLLGMVRDQQTLKGLEGTKLFRDLEIYIREVKMQLTQRQQTDVSVSGVNAEMSAIRALDERTNSLRVLTKLSKLELSRQEWTNLSGNLVFEAFAALGLKQEDFLFHLAFYLNAEERDQIFFDNLKASVTGLRPSVIVAGGFHAEGITSRLKEAGMGYALVMPKINHIPENNSYKAQMRGEVSWKDYFEVENGRIHLYKAFVRATRDKLVADRRPEVGGQSDSELRTPDLGLLKAWRDQIIRDLSDMGKVNRAAWYTRFMDEVVDESLKHTDADKLMIKVDNFIRGLRGLEKNNQIDQANIADLLKASMASPAVTSPAVVGTPLSFPVNPASEVTMQEAWASVRESLPVAIINASPADNTQLQEQVTTIQANEPINYSGLSAEFDAAAIKQTALLSNLVRRVSSITDADLEYEWNEMGRLLRLVNGMKGEPDPRDPEAIFGSEERNFKLPVAMRSKIVRSLSERIQFKLAWTHAVNTFLNDAEGVSKLASRAAPALRESNDEGAAVEFEVLSPGQLTDEEFYRTLLGDNGTVSNGLIGSGNLVAAFRLVTQKMAVMIKAGPEGVPGGSRELIKRVHALDGVAKMIRDEITTMQRSEARVNENAPTDQAAREEALATDEKLKRLDVTTFFKEILKSEWKWLLVGFVLLILSTMLYDLVAVTTVAQFFLKSLGVGVGFSWGAILLFNPLTVLTHELGHFLTYRLVGGKSDNTFGFNRHSYFFNADDIYKLPIWKVRIVDMGGLVINTAIFATIGLISYLTLGATPVLIALAGLQLAEFIMASGDYEKFFNARGYQALSLDIAKFQEEIKNYKPEFHADGTRISAEADRPLDEQTQREARVDKTEEALRSGALTVEGKTAVFGPQANKDFAIGVSPEVSFVDLDKADFVTKAETFLFQSLFFAAAFLKIPVGKEQKLNTYKEVFEALQNAKAAVKNAGGLSLYAAQEKLKEAQAEKDEFVAEAQKRGFAEFLLPGGILSRRMEIFVPNENQRERLLKYLTLTFVGQSKESLLSDILKVQQKLGVTFDPAVLEQLLAEFESKRSFMFPGGVFAGKMDAEIQDIFGQFIQVKVLSQTQSVSSPSVGNIQLNLSGALVMGAGQSEVAVDWDQVLQSGELAPAWSEAFTAQLKKALIFKDGKLRVFNLGTGDPTPFSQNQDYTHMAFIVNGKMIVTDPSIRSIRNLERLGFLEKVEAIHLTHVHFDHVGGILDIARRKLKKSESLPKLKLVMPTVVALQLERTLAYNFSTMADDSNYDFSQLALVSELFDYRGPEKINKTIEISQLQESAEFKGVQIELAPTFGHPIPTYGVKLITQEGLKIAYLSDSVMPTPTIKAADGKAIPNPRYSEFVSYYADSDILIAENGVPGVHITPEQLAEAFPEHINNGTLFTVHSSGPQAQKGLIRFMPGMILSPLQSNQRKQDVQQSAATLIENEAIRDFLKLNLELAQELSSMGTKVSFSEGEVLFQQGNPVYDFDHVYISLSGETIVEGPGAKRLPSIGAGRLIGEMALLTKALTQEQYDQIMVAIGKGKDTAALDFFGRVTYDLVIEGQPPYRIVNPSFDLEIEAKELTEDQKSKLKPVFDIAKSGKPIPRSVTVRAGAGATYLAIPKDAFLQFLTRIDASKIDSSRQAFISAIYAQIGINLDSRKKMSELATPTQNETDVVKASADTSVRSEARADVEWFNWRVDKQGNPVSNAGPMSELVTLNVGDSIYFEVPKNKPGLIDYYYQVGMEGENFTFQRYEQSGSVAQPAGKKIEIPRSLQTDKAAKNSDNYLFSFQVNNGKLMVSSGQKYGLLKSKVKKDGAIGDSKPSVRRKKFDDAARSYREALSKTDFPRLRSLSAELDEKMDEILGVATNGLFLIPLGWLEGRIKEMDAGLRRIERHELSGQGKEALGWAMQVLTEQINHFRNSVVAVNLELNLLTQGEKINYDVFSELIESFLQTNSLFALSQELNVRMQSYPETIEFSLKNVDADSKISALKRRIFDYGQATATLTRLEDARIFFENSWKLYDDLVGLIQQMALEIQRRDETEMTIERGAEAAKEQRNQLWRSIDYYEVLGVSRDASLGDIKNAYRSLVRAGNHPDKVAGDSATLKAAEERFKEIGPAYEVLSNEVDRAEYDKIHFARSEARSVDSGQARDSYERYKLLSGTLADLPDPVFVNDGETITLRIPHDEVEGSQPELDLLVVFKKFNGKVFFAHLDSFSDLSMLDEYYRSADPLQEGSRIKWEEVNETSEVEIIGREEEMDSEGTKVKIVFSEQGFTIANASISDVYYFEGKPGPEIIASALRDSYLSSASTGLPIATEPIFIAGEDATEIFNLVTEFINQGPYVPAAGETALYTKVKQQIRLITERTGEKYRFNPMIQINALSDTYRALNNFLMNRFTDLEGLEKGVVILKRIPNLEKLIEVLRHLISAYELAFNHLENSTIEIEVDEKENHRRHALQMLVELKKIVNSYDSIPPAERPRAEIQGEVRMARLPSQKNFSEFISYNGDKIPLWAIKRIYLPDNRVIQFGEISQANNEDGVYDREDRTRDVRNALSPFPESAEIVFELQDGVLLKRILEAEEYETITAVYPVDFDPKEFSRLPHGIDLPERRFINAVNVNGFITTLYELESLLPETGLAGRTVTFFYSANNHLQAFKISDEAKPQSEQYVYSQFRNSSNVQPMSAPFSAQETQEIAKKDLVDLFADLFNRRALTSAQRVVPLSALILQFLAVSLNAKAVSDWAQEGKVPLFEVELANEQTISFSGLNPALHHDDAVRIERLLSQIDGGLDAASFRIVLAPAGPATQSNQAGQFFDRPGRGLDEFNAWHKLSDVLELFFLSVGETGKDKKLDAASKQKLLDKLAVLVEAIAMIHPSVTGSEIYHTLYAVMDASMFRAKKLDTGSRINVLINLARQIRAAAPQDPQQSIYVQGEFESKLKTPNLDLNELAKETARSEARSADSGQAREAEAVAGDVFGFFKSPADYSADQINTLADEIDTLADKQGLDVFVNLLRSIARDLAVVSVQGSENILSKEATSFAVKLFVGRMMAAKRQSTLIDVKIEKPTIALALKLNDAQKASLGDKLSSELAEILGAVQIEAKDFKELGAFFKSVGVLVTTIDPDLANAVVLESFGADWSGLPAVGVLEESQQFDSELEGMRIYLQLLIAAYLARSFPDKKVILTPEIVGEINKLLFQSDAGQEGIVQIQNGQLVVKRSSLLAYIQTLFAAQSAVAVAA